MTFFQAISLGLIEGVTEFLPISSTFHLLFTSRILGITQTEFVKFFVVFIQAGAILPLLINSLLAWWREKKLFWLTAVAFLPAAVVGFLLHRLIKTVLFESTWFLVVVFMMVGLGFLGLEWLVGRQKLRLQRQIKTLSWGEAIKIGLFQALAIIPGVSRSGSLIAGGMLGGLTREQAIQFSFLLAVPTILAATVLDGWETRAVLSQLSISEWQLLAVGFGVALVSAWLSINWLLKFVRTQGLASFGWYRLGLGVGLGVWLWLLA